MSDPRVKESTLDLSFYRDWVAKRESALAKDKKRTNYFVTVSREYGCEGYNLALKLVERINEKADTPWTLFTHDMITEMISSEEVPADMVDEISETRWSYSDWFADALVPKYLQSQSTQVFESTRNLILNLIDKGNCVLLGSGAQIISHALDPRKFYGVHVRVAASTKWKVARMEKIYDMTIGDAERTLNENQDQRNQFITDFTGLKADDPSLYNMIFNNAKNTPELMADVTLEYLRLKGAFEE